MHEPAKVICNIEARQGQIVSQNMAEWLELAGITGEVLSLSAADVNTELAQTIASNPELLIVAGGDGTVASALKAVKGTDTTLAIIPAGTTNNLARTLGIPLSGEQAVAMIPKGQTLHLSLGHIQTETDHHTFSTAATIGLSAEAIPNTSNVIKRIIGRLAYVIEGLRRFYTHQPFHCQLKLSDQTKKFKTHEIIIANTQHQAGIPLSPRDLKEESQLTLTVLATTHSVLAHVVNFFRLVLGSTRNPTLLQKITSRAQFTVEPKQPLEADGEALGEYSHFTITADTQKARVLIPDAKSI